tara:strand:- start:11153 stop:14632 length:3480 start_codon:yes stop_codon:yes gene_type:complete
MVREFHIFDAPLHGISLVEAGAGTGKTYNIASLFVRTILEKELLPVNILVLTFTEAATIELKSRLRKRLKESISVLEGSEPSDQFLIAFKAKFDSSHLSHLKKALYSFDDAPISTIHGFCQRLLKENALEFGVSPDFEILSDNDILLQDAVDQYWRDFMKGSENEFVQTIQKFIFKEGLTPDKLLTYIKPALAKKYAKIVPKVDSLNSYKPVYQDLSQIYKSIKSLYLEEEDSLDEVVRSGVLFKNSLNPTERYFLPEFLEWLNSGSFTLPYSNIKYFSSFLYEKVKKNKEIPQYRFIDLVDQYLELFESFKAIKSSFIKESIYKVADSFENAKKKKEVVSYNDLLENVASGLNPELISALRKQYPFALIDEFQDTDPVQYSIFKSIYKDAKDTAMFMIGDPKQAIYKFRGADIYTYLEARKDAQYEYSLSFNYRSNPKIINAVNKVFEKTETPFILEGLNFVPASFPIANNTQEKLLKYKGSVIPQMQFLEYQTNSTSIDPIRTGVVESTASEIVNLLKGDFSIDGKKVEQSDIAILVKQNAHALEMQEKLRLRGIRSIIKNKESVFKTEESNELYLIFKALADSTFENGIRAALSTSALGFKAKDILELLSDESKWNSILEKIYYFNRLWKDHGFGTMAEQLLHEFEVELNLANYFDAERRITNTHHIIELLNKAEREKKLTPAGLLRYFKTRQTDNTKNKDDEVIRLESDEKLVQILTIHSSKGLEYPIIFCPYLWDDNNDQIRTPFEFNNQEASVIDIGTEGEENENNKFKYKYEQLSESVRLTYVALTRAKSACFIYTVDSKNTSKSALSSLLEGSENVLSRLKGENKSPSSITEEIKSLSKNEDIKFRQASVNENFIEDFQENESLEFLINKSERDDLFNINKLTSFSALNDSAKSITNENGKPSFDYDDQDSVVLNSQSIQKNQFTLPKGALTGTMLHNIFENIEFDDPTTFNDPIEKEINRAGLNAKWTDTVTSLITNSVNHELKSGIKLKDLESSNRIPEIEFHFPTSNISFNDLLAIIRGISVQDSRESIHGFIKGYIDLTFKVKGKFYILDYKSNHLGDTFQDYEMNALENEIEHSNYDLQYHLYVVALHRMLKLSISDYNYETHFGGVYYLFLRGVNIEDKESGVFFHKPDFKVIDKLDQLFKRSDK